MRWAAALFLVLVALGCGGRQAVILEAFLDGEAELRLTVDTCQADLEADVKESDSRVTITVRASDPSSEDCLDVVTVLLDQPLGGRELIDGATGEAIDWVRL